MPQGRRGHRLLAAASRDETPACQSSAFDSQRRGRGALSRRPEDRGPLPDATRDWKRPVLGYTGTLHADRIDVDLLEAVARKLPEASIALIGPNYLAADDLSRLRSCGNIFLTGQVPYRQLLVHMRLTSVHHAASNVRVHREPQPDQALGIFPARKADRRDRRRRLSRLPPAPDARGADEFVAAIHQALGEGNALWQTQRDEAARHSWRARVDQIEVILEMARNERLQNDGEAAAARCRNPCRAASGAGLGCRPSQPFDVVTMSQTILPTENAPIRADRRETVPPSAPLVSVIVVSHNTPAR